MSKALKKYAYRVTEVNTEAIKNVSVGNIIFDSRHVKGEHEPERVWEFFDIAKAEPSGTLVGKYLGDAETVRRTFEDEPDSHGCAELLKAAEDLIQTVEIYQLNELRQRPYRELKWAVQRARGEESHD